MASISVRSPIQASRTIGIPENQWGRAHSDWHRMRRYATYKQTARRVLSRLGAN